jgi:hypothetical protein
VGKGVRGWKGDIQDEGVVEVVVGGPSWGGWGW